MKKLVFIIILYFVSTVQINELFSQNTTTQLNTKGFFTLDNIVGKWLLISPDEKPFFSIGLNHFDPASLRYAENIHIWEEKYNSSTIEWLVKSVKPNLEKWGLIQWVGNKKLQ